MTNTLTRQEVFDTVLTKLRAQGVMSMTPEGMCMYRGPNDLRCAAGHLIKDEHYDESFERIAVPQPTDRTDMLHPDTVVVKGRIAAALIASGVPSEMHHMVAKMQKAHDNDMPNADMGDIAKCVQRQNWERAMGRIAAEHNLKFQKVQEVDCG